MAKYLTCHLHPPLFIPPWFFLFFFLYETLPLSPTLLWNSPPLIFCTIETLSFSCFCKKKVWIGKTKAHVIKGVVTFWRILVSQLFFNFYYVNLASLRYVIVDYAVIWCLFVKVVPSMYVCLFIRKLAYLCPFFRWIFIL